MGGERLQASQHLLTVIVERWQTQIAKKTAYLLLNHRLYFDHNLVHVVEDLECDVHHALRRRQDLVRQISQLRYRVGQARQIELERRPGHEARLSTEYLHAHMNTTIWCEQLALGSTRRLHVVVR